MSQSWTLLGSWPEALPGEEVRARLTRKVRGRLLKESILTARGWVPAMLTAAVGIVLSLGLSFAVPYAFLVALCQRILQAADPHAAPYLLAGMAYGLPLAAGAWILRRRAPSGAVIRGLQAGLLFFVILAPYVIVQCREFAPALQLAFLLGLAGGAVVSLMGGLCFARLVPIASAGPGRWK